MDLFRQKRFVCFIFFFSVNGGYSDWGPYGKCSKTCGGGVKTRSRTCTNPPPSNGGEDCSALGLDTSTRECNIDDCAGKLKKGYPKLSSDTISRC